MIQKINIKFGLTVSKKIGGAVTRNHVKRIIRTIVRNNLTSIPKGLNFEIIPKKFFKTTFILLEEDFIHLISKMKI